MVLLAVNSASSARIAGFVALGGSQYMNIRNTVEHLASRGHEVWIIFGIRFVIFSPFKTEESINLMSCLMTQLGERFAIRVGLSSKNWTKTFPTGCK